MADEILIDEYTLLNHIATGGSTQVWEAMEKGGGDKHWAMKLMLPEALAQSELRQVLKHEAKTAERFDHPNLVRFEKLVMNKKRGYIVMDYFRAPNLKAQLQTETISLQVRLTRLFEQLCQTLGYLHDLGWVHRDVKPDNILFNKASELRLVDFSLTTRSAGAMSKLIGGKERVIQGTRTYISPETILKAPPSPQADIYSLGVTLFEVLTGDPPFRGTSPDDLLKKHLTSPAPPPSAFNGNVTPEMDRFVLKMLAKKTKDRHKNTHELLAEFRNIKPFKDDPGERDRQMKREQEERYKSTLDKSGRLDSRADHLKQRLLKEDPEFAKAEAEKKQREEAEKKLAAAKAAKISAKEKVKTTAAAPPRPASPAPAAPPAPPQAPPMQGYPAGYGYPGQMPAYPMAGYPPGAGYAPMPGYPQPAGYPQPPGYPPGSGYPQSPGYPVAGHAAAGYPPGGYAPGQPPMQPHQMQPPRGPYAPGQVPPPGYGAPTQPAGGAPSGSQVRLPSGGPQPAAASPQPRSIPRPPAAAPPPNATAQPAIADQQQLLQQLLGQTAGRPAASAAPGPAARPSQGQPAAQRPTAPGTGQDLPLMDQLPPVK